MAICKLCTEKDKELLDRDKQIDRILSGYRKDKKYWKQIIKYLAITIGALILELVLCLAYGKEGILLGVEKIMEIIR